MNTNTIGYNNTAVDYNTLQSNTMGNNNIAIGYTTEGTVTTGSGNIYKLRPVNFIYNNDETNEKQYGLIAEEVKEILPSIVVKGVDGLPFMVNCDMLPILLVKEMQKQQVTIRELKKDNAQRDAIIQNLM